MTVTLRRDGKTQKVPVTIAKLSAEQATGERPVRRRRASGVCNSRMSHHRWPSARCDGGGRCHGRRCPARQSAERAGLQRGDVIREVNRRRCGRCRRYATLSPRLTPDAVALLVKRTRAGLRRHGEVSLGQSKPGKRAIMLWSP